MLHYLKVEWKYSENMGIAKQRIFLDMKTEAERQ